MVADMDKLASLQNKHLVWKAIAIVNSSICYYLNDNKYGIYSQTYITLLSCDKLLLISLLVLIFLNHVVSELQTDNYKAPLFNFQWSFETWNIACHRHNPAINQLKDAETRWLLFKSFPLGSYITPIVPRPHCPLQTSSFNEWPLSLGYVGQWNLPAVVTL